MSRWEKFLCWIGAHAFTVEKHNEYMATENVIIKCSRCGRREKIIYYWGVPEWREVLPKEEV